MIKNIVFDMSRVLMEFDTRRYALLAGVPEADLDRFRWEVYRSPEWLMIERDGITPADAAAVDLQLLFAGAPRPHARALAGESEARAQEPREPVLELG